VRGDAKLRELRAWLDSTHAVRVNHSVLWKVVARLGLMLKESTCERRSLRKREAFAAETVPT
jgi:transposase